MTETITVSAPPHFDWRGEWVGDRRFVGRDRHIWFEKEGKVFRTSDYPPAMNGDFYCDGRAAVRTCRYIAEALDSPTAEWNRVGE